MKLVALVVEILALLMGLMWIGQGAGWWWPTSSS